MKIGMVLYPTYGGSGVVASELGMILSSKGHEVHFITYAPPARWNPDKANILFHEVRVRDYPLFEYAPYESALTSMMVEVAKYQKLDIFHVHYAIPHASAGVLARDILKTQGLNVPVVTTLHGTDITLVGRHPEYEPVISYAIEQSDAVTAVSASLRDETFEHFRVSREIEVVPNFVCPFSNDVDENLRARLSPEDDPIIAHVSNFRPVKRINDIVEVFKEVREKAKAKLLLIGDGPDRGRAEHRLRELGLIDDVIFTGKSQSVRKYLRACDVYLQTSEKESFGLSALEAMREGVPVISTNTGGSPEVTREGRSGFLLDVGDVNGMSERILQIFSDKDLHQRLRNGAIEVAETFSPEHVVPQYEDIYNRLIGQ